MDRRVEQIQEAVVAGRHKEIEGLVAAAVKDQIDLNSIINDGLIEAMDIVGRKFGTGEIYVPEMLVAAATMKKGLAIIQPLLKGEASQPKGTVVMATVKGDLHDIGKNLVSMMIEGAGFRVIDLGVDLSAEKLVEQVAELKPEVLGLSALLTTTMPEMQRVIATFQERGLRNRVKIMVGGAPVDAKFAAKIGADGYGKDAAEAVQLAKKLIGVN
ncbi:MAG: corrinoid protein [Desulfobaccales bacterium]|jgi:5-methyltetrahydrofolate--homocysteine methyltransferase